VVWYLGNTANLALFAALLRSFARAVGAGPDKIVVLVLDNAGWHASPGLAVPEGIVLEFLPAYTPELRPAEHLWPLADEAVANRSFASLTALDEALAERCRTLSAQPDRIKAQTHFSWWPEPHPVN
jgi:transposase